jgi:hypothetical protein
VSQATPGVNGEKFTYDPKGADLSFKFVPVPSGAAAGSYTMVCFLTGAPRKTCTGDIKAPTPCVISPAQKPTAVQVTATAVPYDDARPGGYNVELTQDGQPTQATQPVPWTTLTSVTLSPAASAAGGPASA